MHTPYRLPCVPVPSPSYRRSNLAARVAAAAVPSTAVWAFAVRAAGLFRWGVASGLCVGLFCAALTLKSISFVQQACPSVPPPARSSLAAPDGAAAGGGSTCVAEVSAPTAPTATRGSGSIDGPKTRSRGKAEAYAGGVDGGTAAARWRGQGRRDGENSLSSPSASASPRGSGGTPSPPPIRRLPLSTFGEFAFFLLLAPSLVCEPRLLTSSARRPRRIAAAASEFFHAGLAYLAVHATCSAFFAPIMRLLAAALHSGWADEEGWTELLRSEGSGWWLLAGVGSGSGHASLFGGGDGGGGVGEGGCGGGGGGGGGEAGQGLSYGEQELTTVGVAACLGMFVFTPLMHFLMFYAFFHAVCLGCAELWGYPDRNIYGALRLCDRWKCSASVFGFPLKVIVHGVEGTPQGLLPGAIFYYHPVCIIQQRTKYVPELQARS